MATASVLWRLGRLLVASGVAEKAAERLIERVRTMARTPGAPAGAGERSGRAVTGGDVPAAIARQQARLDALEGTVREQEARLAAIATALEKLGEELRPVLLRSTVTFWLALAGLIAALVALGLVVAR